MGALSIGQAQKAFLKKIYLFFYQIFFRETDTFKEIIGNLLPEIQFYKIHGVWMQIEQSFSSISPPIFCHILWLWELMKKMRSAHSVQPISWGLFRITDQDVM